MEEIEIVLCRRTTVVRWNAGVAKVVAAPRKFLSGKNEMKTKRGRV
jgi:hypothetical protein